MCYWPSPGFPHWRRDSCTGRSRPGATMRPSAIVVSIGRGKRTHSAWSSLASSSRRSSTRAVLLAVPQLPRTGDRSGTISVRGLDEISHRRAAASIRPRKTPLVGGRHRRRRRSRLPLDPASRRATRRQIMRPPRKTLRLFQFREASPSLYCRSVEPVLYGRSTPAPQALRRNVVPFLPTSSRLRKNPVVPCSRNSEHAHALIEP